MKILAIETSCDETAISIVEATGDQMSPSFNVLSHIVSSQVELHASWGGVVPNLARREHIANLIPVLEEALTKAGLLKEWEHPDLSSSEVLMIRDILNREEGLAENLISFLSSIQIPDIDIVAVTAGPGLEPALWAGINFARALAFAWVKPLVPVNHMEGHIVSVLAQNSTPVAFPAVALLVSGGHTELVLVKSWGDYTRLGETRDDAVGEAFDKVARLIGLPYPGGPEISKLAQTARDQNLSGDWSLPRPMKNSGDYDFSFSGIKTAVRYAVEKKGELDENDKLTLAREFEDAVVEVLVAKALKACEEHLAPTLIVGGGVIANQYLRAQLEKYCKENSLTLLLPTLETSTDNATMIALASFFHQDKSIAPDTIRAQGNLKL
ncbi:MAG: tRNA N6-adenosine threonylcarbamoyltransferase [Patescibacteria group bacterium]|nr:tRNA N6-adenosine threonylcarbamoyltransferase [Patescibacteria group bacterium]